MCIFKYHSGNLVLELQKTNEPVLVIIDIVHPLDLRVLFMELFLIITIVKELYRKQNPTV